MGIVVILIIAFIAGYYLAGHKELINIPGVISGNASSTKTVGVYFLDPNKYNLGTEPYEVRVERKVDINKDSKQAVIEELYKGPTILEKQTRLSFVSSGTIGATLSFNKTTGVAKVYLKGSCTNNGSTYTVGNLIRANLKQFSEVKAIRIYDPAGKTEDVQNPNKDSYPACLEP